jgi:hypothetical protein
MKFKVGDRVRIKKGSRYFYDQGKHGIGTIKNKTEGENDGYWDIEFDDGYHNCYSEDEDLQGTSWKARYEDEI